MKRKVFLHILDEGYVRVKCPKFGFAAIFRWRVQVNAGTLTIFLEEKWILQD